MGHYFPKITRMKANVVFTDDGGVWVNYIARGVSFNPYSPESVSAAQLEHDQLFTALAGLETSDIFIGGFKAKTQPDEIMARITGNIPNLSNDNYPALSQQLTAFRAKLAYGEIEEFHRVYWIAVKVPSSINMLDRLGSKVFESDPHEDVKVDSVIRFRDRVGKAIPATLGAVPTTPAHLAWVFDRSRLRGIPGYVPSLPGEGDMPFQPGPKMFAEVDLDGAADTHSYLRKFMDDIKAFGIDANDKKAKDSFFSNFRAARRGSIMSVINPETRSGDFPAGLPSYQQIVGVSGYPTQLDFNISAFTSLVDQVDLDADFVVRMSPAPEALDSEAMSKTLGNVDAEDMSVSKDEIMSADYDNRRQEIYNLYSDTKAETDPTGMRVAVFFAFADMDMDRLNTSMEALLNRMRGHGFRLLSPTGSQIEMWKLMLPCSSLTSLGRDFQQVTTARLFGGYAPLRRSPVGDPQGVPFAINIENRLGQIVHLDLLTGTDQGNASIAFTGAQGSGKSHGMKLVVAWMSDLGRTCYILDQQGEWATFAEGLPSHAVVDMADPTVSIDLFKVLPPKEAAANFVSIFCALLGVAPESEAGAHLRTVAQEAYRVPRKLFTTRALLEHIIKLAAFDARAIIPGIKALLADTSTAALIDPMYDGKVLDLPAFDTNASIVVFLTKGLRNPTPGKAVLDLVERYTVAVNTVLARLTAFRFDHIAGACAFVGDEMSFLEGLEVLTDLIKTPDRTGRKFGNFVVAGSQTAVEMGAGEYALIRRRFVMRQDTQENAVGALAWGELEPTSWMVDQLINETSPLSEERRPIPGREGEGYYFDGTRHARVKIMDQVTTNRRVLADTTSTRMIRRTVDVEG